MKTITHTLLVIGCLFVLHPLLAQDQAKLAQEKTKLGLEIAAAQGANAAKLMAYSWTKSTKVYEKGEEKSHQLVKVWFNSEGKLEGSTLSSESADQQRKKRGVRGAIQKSAGKSYAELLTEATNQVLAYTTLSKGAWIDMMDKAEVSVKNGVINIAAKDVLMPGDQVLYKFDESTKRYLSVDVSTAAKDKPLKSQMKYKTMSDGTNRADVTEIMIPSKSMKIVTENIDFIKQK